MTKTSAHTPSTSLYRETSPPAKAPFSETSVLHLTANMPPDAGFQSTAAVAQSAELQLASATQSESYIGARTTHHSDSEMETVSIATFPSSAQHSSRSRSTEGVGVQNSQLFFSPSNIIATIMQGGILCSVVHVSA